MSSNAIARLIDAGIPIVGGVYVLLLATRVIGKRPGESAKTDEWHENYGTIMKVLGALTIGFGLLTLAGVFDRR